MLIEAFNWISMNNNTSLSVVCCICFSISFIFPTVMPVQILAQDFFPATCYGGKQQLKTFLAEHMVYPREELAAGKDGSASLAFNISDKGMPGDIKVLRTSGPAFTQEAIRLFNLLLWHPANMLGKNISDHQELTITFDRKHYIKTCRIRGYDTIAKPFYPIDSTLKIYAYRKTNKPPEPILGGGITSLQSFFIKNFHYPETALKQNVTGIVIVRFVVESYGIISNVTVDNHLGAGCAEEAIRLVKLIRWKPGIVNNKAVRVNMNLSVTFGLNEKGGFQYQPNQAENSMN
jgi:hypothetical protein